MRATATAPASEDQTRITPAITSVAVGAAIYALWRPSTLKVFAAFECLGLDTALSAVRSVAAPLGQALPRWVVFSLPNGLWAYALLRWVVATWGTEMGNARTVWILGTASLPILIEAAQAFWILPGTFDPVDLVAIMIGLAAASPAIRRRR